MHVLHVLAERGFSGGENQLFATLRYPNGVLVHLHTSWLSPNKTRMISVVGERRMLTFDDMSLAEPIRLYERYVSDEVSQAGFADTFVSFRASVRDGDITIPKIALVEPLREECAHFLECVREGSAPRSGGPEGRDVVRVLEALDSSAAAAGREMPVR